MVEKGLYTKQFWRGCCLLGTLSLLVAAGNKAGIAQELTVPRTQTVLLGKTTQVLVQPTCFNPIPGIIFVHVHEDEVTAVEAATAVLQERELGCFITLKHGNGRNIKFTLGNEEEYQFDPNRMFTPIGRTATLQRFGKVSPAASEAVRQLADYFATTYIDSSKLVIALHNNTNNGGLTIHSYAKGGAYVSDAAAVFINPLEDPDDFIYTTTQQAFDFFKEKGFNVLLQQNDTVTDDGSLSVYAAKKGIDYINIEAEHGHKEKQKEMLHATYAYITAYYAAAATPMPEQE
jgi:hypothetical protein